MDWTDKIKEYGELRNWAPLGRRHALRRFCEWAGIARSGFAADRAFRLGYAALAAANPEERAACLDFQAVKELAERQEETRREEARSTAAEKRKKYEAYVAENRRKKIWRLCGFYVEEQSTDSYTLDEILAWADFARGYMGGDDADFIAKADGSEIVVDLNMVVADQTEHSFAEAAHDLHEYARAAKYMRVAKERSAIQLNLDTEQ